MKRSKLLLTAIAVIAVVSGALAFKAVKYTDQYCAKPDSSGTCSGIIAKRVGSNMDPLYYTTPDLVDCESRQCPTSIHLTND